MAKAKRSAATGASLATCAQLAGAGDFAGVFAALLPVWRAAPSKPLGDVLVRIGELAKQPAAWIPSSSPAPTEISSLLETLNGATSNEGVRRLEAMQGWPTDPRIDRWVAERYYEVPFKSMGARSWWTRLLPLAMRIVDPVASKMLDNARKKRGQERFVTEYLDRIRDRIVKVRDVPMNAEVARIVAAVDEAVTTAVSAGKHKHTETADALLAAVLAKPADDDARIVLADALQELGDPRGELIVLQMKPVRAPAEQKREREIIQRHRARLLGPLARALAPDVTFTKGFVSRGAVSQSKAGIVVAAIAKSVGDPMWATVEHLEGPRDADIARHPIMRSLRSLVRTSCDIDWIAKHPRIESLAGGHVWHPWFPLMDAPAAFRALRELDVFIRAHHVKRFLATKLAKRLSRLRIHLQVLSTTDGSEEFAVFAKLVRSPIPDLAIQLDHAHDVTSGCELRFSPDRRAVTIAVTPKLDPSIDTWIADRILRALDLIEPLGVTSITIERNVRDATGAKRIAARVALRNN